jgi:hypothetical protein
VGREDSEAEAVGEEVWGRHEGDGDRHFDTAADAGFNAGGGEYLTILRLQPLACSKSKYLDRKLLISTDYQ